MMHQKINATNRAAIALLRKCVPDCSKPRSKATCPRFVIHAPPRLSNYESLAKYAPIEPTAA
jgi:hypothetical protein